MIWLRVAVPWSEVEAAATVACVLILAGYAYRAYGKIRRAAELRRLSRERLYRDGMICITCGYNMRTSPCRCSECGHEP